MISEEVVFKDNLLNLYQNIIELFFFLEEFKISLEIKNGSLIFSYEFKNKTEEITFSPNFHQKYLENSPIKNAYNIPSCNLLSFDISVPKNKYSIISNEINSHLVNKRGVLSEKDNLLKEHGVNFFTSILLLLVESLNISIKEIKDFKDLKILDKIEKKKEEMKKKFLNKGEIEKILEEKLIKNFKEEFLKKENFKIKLKNFIFILVIIFILIFYILYKKTNFFFKSKLDK